MKRLFFAFLALVFLGSILGCAKTATTPKASDDASTGTSDYGSFMKKEGSSSPVAAEDNQDAGQETTLTTAQFSISGLT